MLVFGRYPIVTGQFDTRYVLMERFHAPQQGVGFHQAVNMFLSWTMSIPSLVQISLILQHLKNVKNPYSIPLF